MELDIFIPEFNLALEYQGEHHFDIYNILKSMIGSERALEAQQNQTRRDEKKRQACKNNGITLIEIAYTWIKTKEYVLDVIVSHFFHHSQQFYPIIPCSLIAEGF